MALDAGGGIIQAGGGRLDPAWAAAQAQSALSPTYVYPTPVMKQDTSQVMAARDQSINQRKFMQFMDSKGGGMILGLIIIAMSGYRG